MTPFRHSSTSGDSVRTAIPSVISVAQEIAGRGLQAISGRPSAPNTGLRSGVSFGMPYSTRHIRQFPGELSLGW
jgi:hypothetical protein